MKKDLVKIYTCPVHTNETSSKPGKCPKCGKKLFLSTKEKMKMEVMKLYTCPMHPEVTSDKSGKCPKCGMELAKKEQH
jgi:ribosomal protein S27AE